MSSTVSLLTPGPADPTAATGATAAADPSAAADAAVAAILAATVRPAPGAPRGVVVDSPPAPASRHSWSRRPGSWSRPVSG